MQILKVWISVYFIQTIYEKTKQVNMNNTLILILLLQSSTSFACTKWPRFMIQPKTYHPTACSVTRKNVWAGNYAVQINPQLYIFISEILHAKALWRPLKPDGLNLKFICKNRKVYAEIKMCATPSLGMKVHLSELRWAQSSGIQISDKCLCYNSLWHWHF